MNNNDKNNSRKPPESQILEETGKGEDRVVIYFETK